MLIPTPEDKQYIWVFSPVFISLVAFAICLRIIECLISITSTMPMFFSVWRDNAIGSLSVFNIVALITLGLIALAIYDSCRNPHAISKCLIILFSILIAIYVAQIYRVTEFIADIGFSEVRSPELLDALYNAGQVIDEEAEQAAPSNR